MLRELFSSRLFLSGVLFCVLIITVSLLWHQHVERELRESEAETRRFVRQVEKGDVSHPRAEQADTVAVQGREESPLAPDAFSPTEQDTTDALSLETDADIVDSESEPFLEEAIVADAAVEVPVSPFGFGPYPEVPPDYPEPNLWELAATMYARDPEQAKNWELRERVCIKLWQQGKRALSVAMENGRVYPCFPNTVYIDWDEYINDNGEVVQYIARVLGPGGIEGYEPYFNQNIIPPGIIVIPYSEGGINPYSFLTSQQ